MSRENRTTRTSQNTSSSTRSLRVYVSSTYQDLKDCRQAIRSALQRIGVDDIAMETYTAGEERPVDRCVEDVRSADLYVGVLAWRYGFAPGGGQTSITESEYRAAGAAGVPRLIFVLDPEAPWPRSAMDRDSTQIEAFRDHVLSTHVCDMFVSAEDLRAKVAEAVGKRLQEWRGVNIGADAAWEAYCTRLVQEYRRLDLEALTPPDRDEHLQIALRDVFVEPDVREDMPDAELPKELVRKLDEAANPINSEVPRGLDRYLVEQARDSYRRPARGAFDALTAPLARTCVLLGDPGAGKSTLARYLALALAERRTSAALAALDGWRPVLIELRDYALNCGEYETFSDYLDYRKRTDGLGMDRATLESYLRDDGRALLVFDGLDEIFDPRLRETVSRRIAGFAVQCPTVRIVVTSRVVGYRARVFQDAGFVQYTVQDLDRDKIDTFLRSWYELALHDRAVAAEMRRERLTRAINDSAPIRELAGNPLLLTILAIIGKHQELPRERWKVYDHAAGVLVQHWDVNKHLVDEDINADVIREDDKKELLRKLAIRMQEGSHGFAGNSLVEADLFQDIETYLVERFRYERAKAAAISTAMVKQLRERNFIFARYGTGVYGFVHRALLEFFSAGDIVNRFEKARTLTQSALVEVFLLRSEDPAWVEVLRLIAGMVDAIVAARLVDRLLASTGTHRSSALDRRPLAAVALAAQCIAEIRNVNAAAGAAERTLHAIIELLEPPTRSFGDDFRETHLETTVLPAMHAVSAWPGRAAFRDWFVQRGRYATISPAAKLGAQFLAALFPKDEQVHALLRTNARSGIPRQREAALLGLAQTWTRESTTIQLVVDGMSDEEAFIRRTSLDLLVTNWPDDDHTHGLIFLAASDPNGDVRQRAIEALAQHAKEVDGAWTVVTRALSGDGDQSVRDAAVTALASNSANSDEMMGHLLQACSDPAWQVRRSALRLVVARLATEPGVFDRVLDAFQDCDEDVRQTAVELLAGRWPEDPQSINTVHRAIRDVDPKVRRAAVRAMAQRWRDDPEVAEALKLAQTDYDGDVRVTALTARTDPINQATEYVAILTSVVANDPVADARRAALGILVAETPESSVPALRHAIADPDPGVRTAALRSLSGLTPELSSFRSTVLVLCDDAIESVRQLAVEVAARFWGDRPEMVHILHRAARSRSPRLRQASLESLASRWPHSTQTWQALRRGRLDPMDPVRYTAVTAMASVGQGTGERIAAIETAIIDPAGATRLWAGQLLCGLAADSHWPSRLSATATECSTAREAALHAAVRSGLDEATVPAIRTATDDPDPDVRLAAYEIVGARRNSVSDALDLITKSSRDVDPEIRLYGLAALLTAWPDHREAIGARCRGLTDPSVEIRRLAVESAILHDPEAPTTRHVVTVSITDSDWTIRRLALAVVSLQQRDQPETIAQLHAALHHPEVSVRRAIIDALGGTWPDHESTFEALADCTRDPVPSIRVQALRSVATGWPNNRSVPPLLEIARHDYSADVAIAAWELQRRVDDGRTFDNTCEAAGLRRPDVVCRQLAAERLPSLSGTDDVVDLFRVGIRDREEPVWSRVGFALMSMADEQQVRSVLRNAEAHPDHQARLINLHVRAARWPDTTESRDSIRRALRDVDDQIRTRALDLLIEFDPEAEGSLDIAAQALSDPDVDVRSIALRWIATCWTDDPQTPDCLVLASRDYSPHNRRDALTALVIGWPSHPRTFAALRAAESDATHFVREFARRTLIQLAIETGEVTDLRSTGFEQLRRADLCFPDDPEACHTVADLAESANWWVRWEALQVLARRWPGSPATSLALTRALNDDDRDVRDAAVRALAAKNADPSATVSMLREAAKDLVGWSRTNALRLLGLWRVPEAHAALLDATRDQDIDVHTRAIIVLLAGWPTDDRTNDALGWAVCSPFTILRGIALRSMTRGMSDAVPHRATLMTRKSLRDLLLLASWWCDDPEVASVLRDRFQHHDILRTVSLAGILAGSGDDPTIEPLLVSAAEDECPAVRRIALEGLIRMRDPAWITASTNDPDRFLRLDLTIFRCVEDKSTHFSTEIIDMLVSNADSTLSAWLFYRAATVRASTGLLEPAALLAATRSGFHIDSADLEWLQWLAALES